ncbi:Uncharacterised protein [Shewanella putrefaciens]|nr:Uncharacterised protein [Shewanella putrefaciens]
MDFSIIPFEGVGSIKFGMTPKQVRTNLGSGFKSFKRTPDSVLPCDYYEALGVFIYYKLPSVVEAIEFAEPANPELDKAGLLTMSFNEVHNFLAAKDPSLEIQSDSLTSYNLGISVYAPNADEDPNLLIESILLFENGYYD